MSRIRILRVALPMALVAVVAVVLLTSRPRPGGEPSRVTDAADGPRIEGFSFTDLLGERRRLSLKARLGMLRADGSFRVEGVERLDVPRSEGSPLIVRAERGVGHGREGKRLIRLEGGVHVQDESAGIEITLPSLEIDQPNGVARSLGTVTLRSNDIAGQAEAIVYSLDERPSEIIGLTASSEGGSSIRARRAIVRDSEGILELSGEVVYEAPDHRLSAASARLRRDAERRWREIEAEGSVQGVIARVGEPPIAFRSAKARALRDEEGNPIVIALTEDVWIERNGSTLGAREVVANAVPGGNGWTIDAAGEVVFAGLTPSTPSRLQTSSLRLETGDDGGVLQGQAGGGVRFESPEGSGEADSAQFEPGRPKVAIVLRAGSGRRARVAHARTRIVADTISSDDTGRSVTAEGRVEATLLPESAPKAGATTTLFEATEAVHFVADRLESESAGSHLVFVGAVRGWQGERHLAASRVEIEQSANRLLATDRVATRLPRRTGPEAAGADHIMVTAQRLDYRGQENVATYSGTVRVRQAEGWIESERLEVELEQGGAGTRRVRGLDEVRFEFVSRREDGLTEPVTGTGDRFDYDPAARCVRLFGDRRPAEVRRGGSQGGVTAGRVLRYHLDSGSVEVESNAGSGKASKP